MACLHAGLDFAVITFVGIVGVAEMLSAYLGLGQKIPLPVSVQMFGQVDQCGNFQIKVKSFISMLPGSVVVGC